jgi:DNA-binding response OmpR family regulator
MKNILIVDDETVLAETMLMILNGRGYRTRSANDGRQATDLIRKEPPDLVISDLAMPAMDGLQLLEWVRDHRSLDRMKFMIMTGKQNVLEPLKRHHIEADDSIAKPFTETQLLAKVKKLIGPPVQGE